jgi:hypothetical protein
MDQIIINLGQSVRLDWDFINSQSVRLNTFETIYDSPYENPYETLSGDELYSALLSTSLVPRAGFIVTKPNQTLFYQIVATNYLGKEVKQTIKVEIADVPELESISPNPWNSGMSSTVTLNGRNFDPISSGNLVEFQGPNNTRLTGNVISSTLTEVVVEVPNLTLSGPATVTAGDLKTNPVNFTINQINNFIIMEAGNPLFDQHQEAGSFIYNNKAFIVGGFTNLVCNYDGNTNIPNNTDSLSGDRSGFPIARVVGDSAYIIGGNDPFNVTQRYIEKYNLMTGNWEVLGINSLFPANYNGTNRCGSELGTDIYFFTDNGTLKFDTTTETWSTNLAACPVSPIFAKSITFDNLIYVIGCGSNNKNTYSYDPNLDIWTQLTDSPQKLIGHSISKLNNQLVVTGGREDNFLVQIYNPNTDIWRSSLLSEVSSLPITSPKFDHTSEVLNGELYLFGGNDKKVIKLIPI